MSAYVNAIIPDRRTLETDEEYWQRAQSQAVIMRGSATAERTEP